MELRVYEDADTVARQAAGLIRGAVCDAVLARGRCIVAVSGGRTPWRMLRYIATEDIRWDALHVAQVDERVAPTGNAERNLVRLQQALQGPADGRGVHIYAMPVECADLDEAAERYAATLTALAGSPPVLDLVHLGLGADGHTASLIPNDAVLDVMDRDVAITGSYQGRRRMTLTYPLINRARRVVWVVTGAEKSAALAHLFAGDPRSPAARVSRERAIVLADRAAADSWAMDEREQ